MKLWPEDNKGQNYETKPKSGFVIRLRVNDRENNGNLLANEPSVPYDDQAYCWYDERGDNRRPKQNDQLWHIVYEGLSEQVGAERRNEQLSIGGGR